jgi:hypothetical protein
LIKYTSYGIAQSVAYVVPEKNQINISAPATNVWYFKIVLAVGGFR